MNIGDRMQLLDRLGRALQKNYTFSELDLVLKASRIKNLEPSDRQDSKWAYAKERLGSASPNDLLNLARELSLNTDFLDHTQAQTRDIVYPANWAETDKFRLFVSHISKHKRYATRLKEALSSYGIDCFVAHEDIKPTKLWQDEIKRALTTMEAFIAVLSDGFSESIWCQQEIGFAIAKGTKTIAFKVSEDPPGFLGIEQALSWQKGQLAEDIAQEIVALLNEDIRTAPRLGHQAPN